MNDSKRVYQSLGIHQTILKPFPNVISYRAVVNIQQSDEYYKTGHIFYTQYNNGKFVCLNVAGFQPKRIMLH